MEIKLREIHIKLSPSPVKFDKIEEMPIEDEPKLSVFIHNSTS